MVAKNTEWHPARIAIGVAALAMTVASLWLLTQPPSFEDFWPWYSYSTGIPPLSYYFLSSIAAAIAAPLWWIAATDSVHTSPGGALDQTVTFGGMALFMLSGYVADTSNTKLMLGAALLGISALANVAVFVTTRKMPEKDPRPLPAPVRYSFGVFAVTLILAGGALVLKTPNILPWDMSVEAAVVYGWIFLGASMYFIYALFKPLWEYAIGPLLGFLAYDLVLILPLIGQFADVTPSQRVSLIVYLSVVSYSGLLAIYYLLLHPSTRMISSKPEH